MNYGSNFNTQLKKQTKLKKKKKSHSIFSGMIKYCITDLIITNTNHRITAALRTSEHGGLENINIYIYI